MPTIRLTDNLGVDVNAEINEGSSVAKSLKGLTNLKFDGLNFANLKNITLDQAPLKSLDSGITFAQPLAVFGDSEVTIEAGASGGLRLFSPKDEQLFDPEVFADPIAIAANQFYLGFGTRMKFGAAFMAETGDNSFGLSAGGGMTCTTYRLFEKAPGAATFPTCVDAIKETIAAFVIPDHLQDFEKMPKGTVVTAEGSGSLKFAGELNVVSAVNPLAAINLPEPLGALELSSGGSIKVGGSFEISGTFQIRMQKLTADKVRIGFYRKRGTDFGLKVTSAIGASVAVGGFEPLEHILKALSKNPQADFEKLKKELGEDRAETIKKVVEAGISRKLEIALAFELASQTTSEAAFLFDMEFNKLDAAGKKAIQKAIVGNFSSLTASPESLPAGVRLVRSVFTQVQKKQHTVKFNLLGIYNLISVSTLILKGRVMFDQSTGELVITDTATASRISASSFNFAADGEKLRKVLAESVLISAAYRCSKLVLQQPELKIAHTSFELHTKTDRPTMKDNLDVFEALGLMTAAEKNGILSAATQFGRTTLYSETAYDDALVERLFLTNGKARPQTDYEIAGRKALALLVQSGEAAAARRLPATDDLLWKEMTQVGQFNFSAIDKLRHLSADVQGAIRTDYSVIMWWAKSMRQMGEALAEVRDFISKNPDADPLAEPFHGLRKKLGSKLREVAKDTKDEFGDPWGLVAMDQASGQKAVAAVRLNSPTLAILRERKV